MKGLCYCIFFVSFCSFFSRYFYLVTCCPTHKTFNFSTKKKTPKLFCWSFNFFQTKDGLPVSNQCLQSVGQEIAGAFVCVHLASNCCSLLPVYLPYCSLAGRNTPEVPYNHFPNPLCSSSRPGDASESRRPVHADRRRWRRGVCLAGPRPPTTLHLPRLRRRNPLHGHITWPKVPRPQASSGTDPSLTV